MKISEFKKILLNKGYSFSKINKLLEKITGLSKEALFISGDDYKISNYEEYLEKVNSSASFEYIVNSSEFMGIDFYVDERVLIPRDDTSVIVENILKLDFDLLIDVGTGSGTIPIAYLLNVDKQTDVLGLDVSEMAIEVSTINKNKYNLSYKIEKSDLLSFIFDNVDILKNKSKICITANLPYIKSGDFENMDSEVIKNEPDLALYGGSGTGFELYEKLIKQALDLKMKTSADFLLFIEIGFDQREVSENFLKSLGLKFEYFQDTSKIDRVIKIYFN